MPINRTRLRSAWVLAQSHDHIHADDHQPVRLSLRNRSTEQSTPLTEERQIFRRQINLMKVNRAKDFGSA
jgi:hypothetical protein